MSHAITPNPSFKPEARETLDVVRPFVSVWLTPDTHMTVDVSTDGAEFLHCLADAVRMMAYRASIAARAGQS